ncbi:hypothetical protein [Halomarina pelagica]|uniref:hypothetical protein n=1 Tax=Halomarina pelagica TaxID=2961599 RepID=UPI0020C30682|nr:hypothetical protein [Halomarina sp. BND7]
MTPRLPLPTPRASPTRARLVRAVFGDRAGVALFLGAVAFYALYWRVDVFIVDTFALANALANLERGHLAIETVVYGPDGGATPGTYYAHGRRYGRNYGQVALALPVLFLLRAVALVADVRLAVAGAWSLAVYGAVALAGRELGRPRRAATVGVGLASALFVANLATATALPDRALPLVALQASTLLAAGFVVVVAYRLALAARGRRTAAFAASATGLLGPVGFWAVVPKRHVLLALLALVAVYGFYRSRAVDALGHRALAYAAVALAAWVSAPDAVVLLAALVPLDLLTARSNDRRRLAVVAGVFALALAPFLLTNLLVAGNPLVPPRMLPSYVGQDLAASPGSPAPSIGAGGSSPTAGADGASPGGSPGTAGGGGGGTSNGAPVRSLVERLSAAVTATVAAVGSVVAAGGDALTTLSGLLGRGYAVVTDGSRLYHVFVRSGRIPGVDYSQTGGETIDLALLEVAPVLACLAAVPVAIGRRRSSGGSPLDSPAIGTGAFVGAFAVLCTLLYLPRLPLHSTVTVRYLAPTVPALLFVACLSSPVSRAVTDRWRALWVAALVAAGAGALVLGVGLAGAGLSAGALMQAHAVANLTVAATLAVCAAAAGIGDRSGAADAALAVALGTSLAAMALFALFSGIEYLGAGRAFALPLADLLETTLTLRR